MAAQPTDRRLWRACGAGSLCARGSAASCLVLGGLGDADLGVVLLGLELELDREQQHAWLDEALWLLLEARVGEGLLEGDALHQD